MNDTLKLAVVILNWNGKHFLERFLPVLLNAIPEYAEVVVADNASTDDSVEFLRMQYPNLRLIINAENGGFAKGYNDALKKIDTPYYCLLNSDIEVSRGWIEPVMSLFDSNPDVAAIQPKICSFKHRDFFEYAGAAGGFLDKWGYPFCRGRLFDFTEQDSGQYDTPTEVFWATGAALFVRSEVYHRLGGLDEDFFAHMEEIDFCWRLKNNGYKLMMTPDSVVYHVGGGTLPKNNALKTYLNFRNNLYLLLKNLPASKLFSTLFVRFFLDQIAALVFLLKGQTADFAAVYKAMFDFVKNYKNMKAKRTNIRDAAYQDLYPYSIVVAHYLRNKKIFDGKKLL